MLLHGPIDTSGLLKQVACDEAGTICSSPVQPDGPPAKSSPTGLSTRPTSHLRKQNSTSCGVKQ